MICSKAIRGALARSDAQSVPSEDKWPCGWRDEEDHEAFCEMALLWDQKGRVDGKLRIHCLFQVCLCVVCAATSSSAGRGGNAALRPLKKYVGIRHLIHMA